MNNSINETDIVSKECRFSVYCKPPEGETDDYHLVKEILHTKDNKTISNVKLIKNFERTFYTAKNNSRNYQQKREWADLEELQEHKTTQSNLIRKAANALGQPWFNGNLRKLARSPYLYGADILSTAIIKQQYRSKYPNIITPYSMACYDTETDMLDGTEQVIIATISFKDRVYTGINRCKDNLFCTV
jgi:hypothetical protein